MDIRKCLNCDKEIPKMNLNTCSNFCSGQMKIKNSSEERTCPYCKNIFVVRKKQERKLCSDECRKSWALMPENKKLRFENTKKAVKEKYGVEYYFSHEDCPSKIKATKKEKYGSENYVNIEKAKQSKKDKYGNECFNNIEKILKTKEEKYGDKNYNNRPKAEATSIDRFGEVHAMKLKEYQDKQINTLKNNYGVDSPLRSHEIKMRQENTNIDRYGFKSPSGNQTIKNKIKQAYYNGFKDTKMFEKLKDGNISLIDKYEGIDDSSNKLNVYTFECNVCKSKFKCTFSNNIAPICRTCFPVCKNTKQQILISDMLRNYNTNFFENIRDLICPLEVDFHLPEHNIAIELNGNYFHSELGGNKDKEYHLNKSIKCEEKNILLMHFFEDEVLQKPDIVKNIILNGIGLTKEINVENHVIKKISVLKATEFLIKNNIFGVAKGIKSYGLFSNKELVSILSVRKCGIGKYAIVRYGDLIGGFVKNSFELLFNHFVVENKPANVIAFDDCRIVGTNNTNSVFNKMFEFCGITEPKQWFFKKSVYTNRFEKCSDYIDWIWDCGSMKFEINF